MNKCCDKIKRRLLTLALVVSMLLGQTVPAVVSAENAMTNAEILNAFAEETGIEIKKGTTDKNNTDFEIKSGILTAYYGNSKKVTVPNTVIAIGEKAFYECKSISSIIIPNTVISIGDLAFYGCESLSSITIPNSVKSIGVFAFEDCISLTKITIPNSVTNIGRGAFEETPWLKAQQKKNPLVVVNGILIDGSGSKGDVTIPKTVTTIGDSAFYCASISSITIPNTVTSIGYLALANCNNLRSIVIPSSVTRIGERAIAYCDNLSSITIPKSVTSIGEWAFFEHNKELTINGTKGSYAETYFKENGISFKSK